MFLVKITLSFFNRTVMLLVLLSFSASTYSQEICNNGIDDNANGLIDLNDTADCPCTQVMTQVPSLIPNPSFETMACCPNYYSQMNCAQSWVQASPATADYMNTCDFIFPAATAAGLVPFPDGNGMAGLISSIGYQEYIGSCLISPMLTDSSYSLQMNIASTPIDGNGNACNGGVINYAPSDIVLYGSTNCSDIPFSGMACPPSNWQILGTALYTPVNTWGTITITFTPTVNINAIIIGSPCTLPPSYAGGGCYPYFYFDNLLLNKTSLISSITQTGNWCSNTAQLTGNAVAGATYQWYSNGVALVGQTNLTLNVSGNNLPAGNYSLVTIVGSDCSRASISVVASTNPPVIFPAGPFCKYQPPFILSANMSGGTWSGTGITDSIVGVFNPGMAAIGNNSIFYSLPNTDNCPRADTITILVNDSPISNAGSDITICSGAAGNIGTSPIAGYFYSWTPPTGLSSSTASNPGITTVNTGTSSLVLNYSLITTDASTTCQASDQVVVTINPTPAINPAGPFCQYDPPLNLTATIAGGTWSGTGITNISTGAFDPSIATVGNNTIIYTVAGACPDSDTLIIVVNTIPVSNAGTDLTICFGTAGNIGASAIAGNTYSWLPSTGLSNSAISNPSITTINNGTTPLITTYTLTTTITATNCQSTDSVIVTVNPQPVLTITNPPAVCSPATADITATPVTSGTTGGGVLSYWIDSLATTILASPVAIGTSGAYYIKITATGGCIDIQPVVITINPTPVSDAGADITLCTGDTGNIGDTAIPGYTYSWNPISSLTSSTDANPAITLLNPDSVTIMSTYIITTTMAGCVSTDTVNVTINPLATADAGPAKTICASSSAVLTGVVGLAATTGTWNGGNGIYTPNNTTLNTLYTPSLSEITSGSVILTLVSNDPPGACPAATSAITITINQVATGSAGLDDTICNGTTAALFGVFGGTATNGTWSEGGGIYNPNNNTPNAVYTPTVAETETGSVSLIFTTDDPAGPCPAVSDTAVITISPPPTANAGSVQYQCSGSNITLAGTIGGAASGATWSGGTGTYSPDNTSLNAVYIPGIAEYAADSVLLTLTTNNPIGFPCAVSSSNVTIYFYKNPVVNFIVDDAGGCPIHCVNYTDSTLVDGGATITNWSWNFGDNSPVSNTQNPSHCYSQMGVYDVTLTATSNNNCSDTLTIPQMIQIFPVPVAEFYPTPNPATLLNSTITLNNQSSSDVNYWFWSFGDGDTLTMHAPNAIHLYPGNSTGSYPASLVVQNAFGCADTVIHEIVIGPEFSFFIPNAFTPNNDGINDYFRGEGTGIVEYKLMIFDRWGNMIFFSDDLNSAWDGKANDGTEVAQQDVYVWKVKLTDVFRKKYDYIGTVTIVR